MSAAEAVRESCGAIAVGELLARAREQLAEAPHRPPGREATLLLARVLAVSEAHLLAHPELVPSTQQEQTFQALLARRFAGEPVAYLLGEREFYGRSFVVDRRVLIPRPETELLVEHALRLDLPKAARVLDLGTGSGCLAVTLLAERASYRAVATDLSLGALVAARHNARRHGVGNRVDFLLGDMVSPLRPPPHIDLHIDLVVSNPPYVDRRDAASLSLEIREYEPALALYADDRGTALYRRLLGAGSLLPSAVPILLEIGCGQLERVLAIARAGGFLVRAVLDDLAGCPRVVELQRPRAA